MNPKTNITHADILEMGDYEAIRTERRAEIAGIKKHRRLSVGPHATFYFECYDTVWYQIHEMLRIEKGGKEQIPDEIEAYDTLIPKGSELVATLMFEIPDAEQRARVLARARDALPLRRRAQGSRRLSQGVAPRRQLR